MTNKVMNEYAIKGRFIPHQIYKELRRRTKCKECGLKKTKKRKLQIHHKIPVSQGGQSIHTNLIVVCIPCHEKLDKKAGVK